MKVSDLAAPGYVRRCYVCKSPSIGLCAACERDQRAKLLEGFAAVARQSVEPVLLVRVVQPDDGIDDEVKGSAVLRLVADDIREASEPAAVKPTKAPGDQWSDADLRALLDQFSALRKSGVKAAAAHAELAKAWCYKVESIRAFLTRARALPTQGVSVKRTA